MPTTAKPKSGLRSLYRIELDSGDIHELQTELSDVLRWESQHDGQSWATFPMPLARQMWVAWRAGRRLKLWDAADPDLWMDTVVDYEDITPVLGENPEDGESEQDPTKPAPSA